MARRGNSIARLGGHGDRRRRRRRHRGSEAKAANADLSQIKIIDINGTKPGGRPLDHLSDKERLANLEEEIRNFPNVRLVIIDPITALMKSPSISARTQLNCSKSLEGSASRWWRSRI